MRTNEVNHGCWLRCACLTLGVAVVNSLPVHSAYGQTFVRVTTSLPAASDVSLAWGDYDNDGDLDVLIAGGGAGMRVYRNTGGAFAVAATLAMSVLGGPGQQGSAAWGDFDNDGDLDILRTGYMMSSFYSRVYRNTGGSFALLSGGLLPVSRSSAAWGDADNDGFMDILLSGLATYNVAESAVSRLYRNNRDGTFVENTAHQLPAAFDSCVAWGDYNRDGTLDILIAGAGPYGQTSASVHANNGDGSFTENPNASLTGVAQCGGAWADLSAANGLPSAVLAGVNGSLRSTRVYVNDGANLYDSGAPLVGVSQGSVAVGDCNNDGNPDVLLTGNTGSGRLAKVYLSNGNLGFIELGASLDGVSQGCAVWGDYDNDGDLDALFSGYTNDSYRATVLYRNTGLTPNQPPTAPGGLASAVDGGGVTLSWVTGPDDTTPPGFQTFEVRIGTTPGGCDVRSPQSDAATGRRRVAQAGAIRTTEWRLSGSSLAPGTYYWSVQSVDAGLAGSAFAAEQTFYWGGSEPMTWYVATDGVNRGAACSNPETPCATITHALGQAHNGDTIRVAAGVYTEADIDITKSVRIVGQGPEVTVVQANASAPLYWSDVWGGVLSISSSATVSVSRIHLRNGSSFSSGGGIYNAGSLLLSNVWVSACAAKSGDQTMWSTDPQGYDGGGIYNDGSIELDDCQIKDCRAGDAGAVDGYWNDSNMDGVVDWDEVFIPYVTVGSGGGLANAGTGTATVRRSRVQDNSIGMPGPVYVMGMPWGQGGSYGYGGNVYASSDGATVLEDSLIFDGTGWQGDVFFNGDSSLALTNCTVVADFRSYPYGSGRVKVSHSTLAFLSASTYTPDAVVMSHTILGKISWGGVSNLGYNVIGNATNAILLGSPAQLATVITNVDLRLGPLQDNGGPTETRALLPGSPAINAGDPAFAPPPATDQRGEPRVKQGRIDIGAFESDLTHGPLDTDGDGMPDEWEQSHGLASNNPADAADDPDRDGRSNHDEYVADTHPGDSNSVFRVVALWASEGAAWRIGVTGSAARVYQLQRAPTPTGVWQTVTAPAAGSGSLIHLEDASAPAPGSRFYRVGVAVP